MLGFSKKKLKGIRIELSITHNGHRWVAKNNDLYISAIDLKQLDIQLKRNVKAKYYEENRDYVDVNMSFDNQTVPEWIRQYSNHYFNRRVRVSFD